MVQLNANMEEKDKGTHPLTFRLIRVKSLCGSEKSEAELSLHFGRPARVCHEKEGRRGRKCRSIGVAPAKCGCGKPSTFILKDVSVPEGIEAEG